MSNVPVPSATKNEDEVDAMYRGLSIDLTNCLSQRNQELLEARKAIATLIVAAAAPESDTQQAIVIGRKWLKNYNDRMYSRVEAVNDEN